MPRLHLIPSILVSVFVRIGIIICHVKNIHLATEERNIAVVLNGLEDTRVQLVHHIITRIADNGF